MAAQSKAQRAVGTAMAHNRIAVLIPCHRVIRENGDAGLYRWGAERKRAIISREQFPPDLRAMSGKLSVLDNDSNLTVST